MKVKSKYGRFETLHHWRDEFVERNIPPAERLVFFTLWDNADENGKCTIALCRLADLTGLAKRTVMRALKKLLAYGDVMKRLHKGKMYGDCNQYQIACVEKKVRH